MQSRLYLIQYVSLYFYNQRLTITKVCSHSIHRQSFFVFLMMQHTVCIDKERKSSEGVCTGCVELPLSSLYRHTALADLCSFSPTSFQSDYSLRSNGTGSDVFE